METGRLYRGESKEDRVRRRQEQFLAAGLEVFGTIGLRAATVKGLCREAGLSDRYFYESFDSLETLFIATYRQQTQLLKGAMLTAVASVASSDTRSSFIESALHALLGAVSDPRVARLCWVEVLGNSQRIDSLYLGTRAEFAALLIQLARLHVPNWKVPPAEERALSGALVGAVNQSIQNWVMSGRRDKPKLIIQANVLIFEGVLMRLAQTGREPRKNSSRLRAR